MKLLNYFKAKRLEKNSASLARERLRIIVAHQRSETFHNKIQPEYIRLMEREIMKVIKKYINVTNKDIKIELDKHNDCSVLELNITIPESET